MMGLVGSEILQTKQKTLPGNFMSKALAIIFLLHLFMRSSFVYAYDEFKNPNVSENHTKTVRALVDVLSLIHI